MSEISSRKMSLNACENEIRLRFTRIVCERLFSYNNHKGELWLWKLKKNIFSSVYAPPEKVIIIKMKHFHLSPDSSRLVPFISVIWSVSSREPCALLSALLQCCSVLLWIICSLSQSVWLSNEQKWDSPARLSFHPFILPYVYRADTSAFLTREKGRAVWNVPLLFFWARGTEERHWMKAVVCVDGFTAVSDIYSVYYNVKGSFN